MMKTGILAILIIACISAFALAAAFAEKKEELGENLFSDNLYTYRNDNMGFEIGILEGMKVNNYLEGIVTDIENDDIKLSIFYDDFTHDLNNYGSYISYANNFLTDTKNY